VARSVALVLGAGGVVGRAYLVGTLAALEEETGWDPRTADLIVGTSAGAGCGSTLRAGLSVADHVARLTDQAVSPEGAALLGDVTHHTEFPDPAPRPGRWPRPQSAGMVLGAFARVWPPRVSLAYCGFLPRGTVPTDELGEKVVALHGTSWPEPPLWVCAVRLRDGRRVVFGRDPLHAPLDLGTAVEASSAVPGYFQPVRVAGESYIDGAAHSPSNADLVAGLGFDVVVVISPMAADPRALAWHPRSASRAYFHRLLDREVSAIRRSGSDVVVFEPAAEDLALAGNGAMDSSNEAAIVSRARATARRRMATSGAGVLADLP
jgi:NTE family protein